jgi:hypothetical protein
MRNVLERIVMRVELSLRVRRAVVKVAKGLLTKTRTASCGRYAKANIPAITATDKDIVGASFDIKGFHNARWLRK